jgi:hypothetical protein
MAVCGIVVLYLILIAVVPEWKMVGIHFHRPWK